MKTTSSTRFGALTLGITLFVLILWSIAAPASAKLYEIERVRFSGSDLEEPIHITAGSDYWRRTGVPEAIGGILGDVSFPPPMVQALGPRYRITYHLRSIFGVDVVLRQNVFPYAHDGPISFTSGMRADFGHRRAVFKIQDQWARVPGELMRRLEERGLRAPAPRKAIQHETDWRATWVGSAGLLFLLGARALGQRRSMGHVRRMVTLR